MQYVGIQTQQRRNNLKSFVLLLLFPCLVILLTWFFCWLLAMFGYSGEATGGEQLRMSYSLFIDMLPYIAGGILVWFLIAYFTNTFIIKNATGAQPMERKDNKRVYNLLENLCISQGMKMPKLNIIYDDSLNAYASGINDSTYTVTLSKGIIEKLDDEELEAVIAHELSHIRNRDVRLLIVSIVFVGIFAMLAEMAIRSLRFASVSRNRDSKNGGGMIVIVFITIIVAAIGYFFAALMRFAISRKREYMADAGSAEMTKNPQALANALKKISEDPCIEAVTRDDVAQLFIDHPGVKKKSPASGFSTLFATHPPIEKRIEVLEQF